MYSFHAPVGVDCDALVTKLVTAFRSHPALLGWYLNDEYKEDHLPDLLKRNALVTKLDPDHVTYSVEDTGNATRLALYKKTSALFGVDPYPWQNATLTHDIHKQADEIIGRG
jgi:hypothetical protein